MDGALVTGAASGIGRAAALRLARDGHRLALIDRDEAGLASLSAHLQADGVEHFVVAADVTDHQAIDTVCRQVVERYGRLRYAVNAAGIDPETVADDWNMDDARKVLDVNVMGVINCVSCEVSHMRATGGGAIVNIASIASFIPLAGKAGYVASKHAIAGVTKTAALQYGPEGIRVNAVCPGATRTKMTEVLLSNPDTEAYLVGVTPLRKIGEPEDMANAISWFLSDESSFVTGQALVVDGGMTLP